MFVATSTLIAFALVGSAVGGPVAPEPVPEAPPASRSVSPLPAAAPVAWAMSSAANTPSLPTTGQQERQPIDVNTATAEDLQKVPGIGEALAGRIIEFRQEHGRFEKVDDLLNVRGIGTASLEKLRPFLVVKKQG